MKSYPAYKKSGLKSVNEIPSHWQVKPLNYLTKDERYAFTDGPFGSDLKNEEYQDDGVPLIQLNNIAIGEHLLQNLKFISEKKAQELTKHNVFPGEIVIAKMADPVARAALVKSDYQKYVIVADCVKMSPNTKMVYIPFLVYSINAPYVRFEAELFSRGTTRLRINLGAIKKLRVLYPPYAEQKVISDYLDRKTAAIDTLITKKQRQIEHLQEYRAAIINQAVTKGLDPAVPMKDSTVEWLGEIPAIWEIVKAKQISSVFVPQRNKPELNVNQDGTPWITMEDLVSVSVCKSQKDRYVSDEQKIKAGSRILSAYSVIASCVGNFGVSAVNTCPVIINQQLQAYIPERINPWYLNYFIPCAKAYFEAVSTAATLPYVNQRGFGDLPVAVPSKNEQAAIVSYLDQKSGEIDQLIIKVLHGIRLLQEYRTAIISAAVTGKIDVRDEESVSIWKNT